MEVIKGNSMYRKVLMEKQFHLPERRRWSLTLKRFEKRILLVGEQELVGCEGKGHQIRSVEVRKKRMLEALLINAKG